MPYTYLIGWKEQNLYYYGVRYARGCHPSELMKTYFTSSSEVAKIINEFGLPNIVEIRKTFNDIASARLWEHKVLRRMKVVESSHWLNKTDNKAIAPMIGESNWMYGRTGELSHRFGTKHSDETKKIIGKKSVEKWNPEFKKTFSEKMSQVVTGRKHKEETKKAISDALTGKPKSEEHKKRISLTHPDVSGEKNGFYGKSHSEETKKHLSSVRKGTMFVNNGIEVKRVSPEKANEYLSMGWTRGKGKKQKT